MTFFENGTAKKWGQKHKIAAKWDSAASRNRIRTCPQNTQMDADEEFHFGVCVFCGQGPFLYAAIKSIHQAG